LLLDAKGQENGVGRGENAPKRHDERLSVEEVEPGRSHKRYTVFSPSPTHCGKRSTSIVLFGSNCHDSAWYDSVCLMAVRWICIGKFRVKGDRTQILFATS